LPKVLAPSGALSFRTYTEPKGLSDEPPRFSIVHTDRRRIPDLFYFAGDIRWWKIEVVPSVRL
jgi:hypothetical protein